VDPLAAVAGVFCLATTAILVVIVIATRRRERRRHDGLTRWAAQNGWTLVERPAVSWGARLPGGNPQGVDSALFAVVHGRGVGIGEYSYSETQITSTPDGSGGATTATHHFVVTVARLGRALPSITVQPRGKLSRVARGVFGPGETATGHDAFDRAFRIATSEPRAVRDWCTPALIAEHLAGRVPPWSVYGDELLTYRAGRIDAPSAIPAEIHPTLRLATLLG
jgi:hypothetical protein